MSHAGSGGNRKISCDLTCFADPNRELKALSLVGSMMADFRIHAVCGGIWLPRCKLGLVATKNREEFVVFDVPKRSSDLILAEEAQMSQ